MNKSLSTLLPEIEVLETRGLPDCFVSGLQYDSRKIRKGDLFCALPGVHSDGGSYIEAAIRGGAVAVLHEKALERYSPGVAYLRVSDARRAMSGIAAAFHDHPSSALCVIGVTGTEGKSTTVSLIYQLLNLSGFKAGFFSTVMSDTGSGEKPNPEHQTTPEATSVHEMLAAMRDSGCRYAVVEASSHGLSSRTGRLSEVDFDVGILTNVTHEHLEFHGTWERYRSDKANLFRNLDAHGHEKEILGKRAYVSSFGIVNADDPSAAYFASCTKKPVFSFSVRGAPASLRALDIASDKAGSRFTVEASEDLAGTARFRQAARTNLPGEYNVGNCLAALIAVSAATGRTLPEILPLLPSLKPVRGRMMNIDEGQPFEVVIDYAHTPSSFEAILRPLRLRVKGKIICLFGSAGERDREKRPQQGLIASKYCDVLILTDEDPRGEDPMGLLEEISGGCPDLPRGERLFLIPDRLKAIRKAFSLAEPGDVVLLLGKGHENSIIYKDRAIPYDEESAAIEALCEIGYSRRRGGNPEPEKDRK